MFLTVRPRCLVVDFLGLADRLACWAAESAHAFRNDITGVHEASHETNRLADGVKE